MRLHAVSLAHTATTKAYEWCASASVEKYPQAFVKYLKRYA